MAGVFCYGEEKDRIMGRAAKYVVGANFGKLTILEIVKRGNKFSILHCICDCGEECIRNTSYISMSKDPCCPGCTKIKRGDNARKYKIKEYGYSTAVRSYNQYKRNAVNRGLSFEFTLEQFVDIVTRECHYCPNIKTNCAMSECANGDFLYTGLDRVDNTKGYTLDNCVPCCSVCNTAKNNYPVEVFEDWVIAAANKIIKRRGTGE